MSMTDEEWAGVSIFLFGIVCLVVIPIVFLLYGWVLDNLWAWFIEPLGAPDISLVHAGMLAMIIGWLTENTTDASNKKKTAQVLLSPFIMLVLGWVVHTLFM